MLLFLFFLILGAFYDFHWMVNSTEMRGSEGREKKEWQPILVPSRTLSRCMQPIVGIQIPWPLGCPSCLFDGGHWSGEEALQSHGARVEVEDLSGIVHQQQSFYWTVVVKRELSLRVIYWSIYVPALACGHELFKILHPEAKFTTISFQCGLCVWKGCVCTLSDQSRCFT